MAAACRDGFIVPLPLATAFLHVVRGGTLDPAALPSTTEVGGRISAYATVVAKLAQYDAAAAAGTLPEASRRLGYEAEADAEFGQSRLGLSTALSLRQALELESFVCPLTQAPLGEGATSGDVTIWNLAEYVQAVAQLWLSDGIVRQAAAFRAGIEDLSPAPEILLAPFSLPELQTMLCGTTTIAPWSEAELRAALQPAAPYTRESPPYALLIETLMQMGEAERAKFLTFVSACPHLPPVGLKALAISVHRLEPVGLRWSRCADGKPSTGRELRTSTLAEALRHKQHFSLEQFVRFGVRDLHADDYVKVKPLEVPAATDADVAASGGGSGAQAATQYQYYYPSDTPTPTSHTCTATLSLPAYTTAAALRAGLDEAFANMEKGGLHEQSHR